MEVGGTKWPNVEVGGTTWTGGIKMNGLGESDGGDELKNGWY